MPPRSESAMPPKLELVLRRLAWLGAPKVPYPKFDGLEHFCSLALTKM